MQVSQHHTLIDVKYYITFHSKLLNHFVSIFEFSGIENERRKPEALIFAVRLFIGLSE